MIKEFFISLVHYFVDITTAVLIAATLFLTITGQQVSSYTLWEILLSGIITAIPSAILLYLDTKSVKLSVILWLIHFVLIYLTTLFLLKTFGWCEITPSSAGLTFFAVVFIYLFTGFVHYLSDKKNTVWMNQQLKKRYFSKNNVDKM